MEWRFSESFLNSLNFFISFSLSTSNRVRQIPCREGTLIKELYEEVALAERQVKSNLQLGKVTDWIISHKKYES